MNAKFGDQNVANFETVMGKHGLGVHNNNAEQLCEMCDLNELVINGKTFPTSTRQHGFHQMEGRGTRLTTFL